MSIARRYTKELRRETHYSATWLPIVKVSAGDVGRMDGYEYTAVTTLKDLGIPFETEDGTVEADIDYTSKGAVSTQIKLEGTPPETGSPLVAGKAGLTVEFKSSGAVLFSASGCRSTRIRDLKSVGDLIVHKAENGEWEGDLVVVTEVVTASTATVLIAREAGARVDLVASGKVTTGTMRLADASANFSVVGEKEMGLQLIGKSHLTPLFRAGGVRKGFLLQSQFRGIQEVTPNERALEFAEVDYDHFDR